MKYDWDAVLNRQDKKEYPVLLDQISKRIIAIETNIAALKLELAVMKLQKQNILQRKGE